MKNMVKSDYSKLERKFASVPAISLSNHPLKELLLADLLLLTKEG